MIHLDVYWAQLVFDLLCAWHQDPCYKGDYGVQVQVLSSEDSILT